MGWLAGSQAESLATFRAHHRTDSFPDLTLSRRKSASFSLPTSPAEQWSRRGLLYYVSSRTERSFSLLAEQFPEPSCDLFRLALLETHRPKNHRTFVNIGRVSSDLRSAFL